MKKFNDIEQLSQYIDGQLNSSDCKQLESRIASDPELASDLNEIRGARGILRKLPARKAPRNFTLTRQMVGLKPPLPQSYSFFRFSSAFATLLLVLTFAANALPKISFGAAAPLAQEAYGIGGSGGGDGEIATEAPAATEPPALEMPFASAATELPATELPSADTAPAPEESTLKEIPTEAVQQDQDRASEERDAIVPINWQIILLIISIASAAIAFMMIQNAKKKWS